MTTPFDDEAAATPDPLDPDAVGEDEVDPLEPDKQVSESDTATDGLSGDAEEQPAPGGPNDPGASASNENQADTPGYAGGGDADPTLADDPEGSLLDDPGSESQFGDSPQEMQGEDPASGGA